MTAIKRVRARPGEALDFILHKAIPFRDKENCLEWPFAKTPDGYGHLKIDEKFRVVSRVICEEVNGLPSSPDLQAAHSCGFSSCCNPWHLSWKTRKENEADKITHGTQGGGFRFQRGNTNSRARLTETQVRLVRVSDKTNRELALEFGVSASTISSARLRKNWAWLKDAA